jgi:hypothetical protein
LSFRDHYEGFENEEKFNLVLGLAIRDCPVLMARTVEMIVAHYAPEVAEKLFEIRECRRRLRYVGCGCAEKVCPHGPDFFEHGRIYESINFTGATYMIKGYGDETRRIGCAYFEWVKEEEE